MDALQLTKDLVEFVSPSHVSNSDVSNFIVDQLRKLGFDVELLGYADDNGTPKVNVMARKGPDSSSGSSSASSTPHGLAYFCHSDVVPAEEWTGPGEAYKPTEHEGRLYGRGSCDMKGSAACMLSAIARIADRPLTSPLYFVCTSDEELSYIGAHHIVQHAKLYREMVEQQPRVLIGEPTELEVVYAHKGVCELVIQSKGEAAHSSTRDGLNANLAMIPFLQDLKAIYDETETSAAWQNDEFDPPTMSLNIGINDHTKALNVKPAQSICTAFYRPLPGIDDQSVIARIRESAERNGLEFTVRSRVGAVYTDSQSDFVREAVGVAGRQKASTVSYGTDAGALTELQHKIVCGPGSIAQAHKSDEWIDLKQLELGTDLFGRFLERWCL